MLAGVTWLWLTRDRLKCLLVFAFGLAAWLVAVNTASEVFSNIVASELFGTKPGAKDNREILGLLVGGLAGGAAGSGLVTFGLGFATPQIRRMQSALPIVATGTVLGLLLYPTADLDVLPLLLVPWQTLVAAAIAYALTLPKT
jgi:Na+/phosphate symporter